MKILYPITDPWDWYIHLHEWLMFMVNVGKYTIHGSYGIHDYVNKKVTDVIYMIF